MLRRELEAAHTLLDIPQKVAVPRCTFERFAH